jgi:hypothetical protein
MQILFLGTAFFAVAPSPRKRKRDGTNIAPHPNG